MSIHFRPARHVALAATAALLSTTALSSTALATATQAATPSGSGNSQAVTHPKDPVARDSAILRWAVTVRGMERHLRALQAIADRHGDRAAGRPGYEASARYVEHTLRWAGYRTERQYFDFGYEELLALSVKQNSPTARTVVPGEMSYSPDTPVGGVTADIVAPVDPLGCTADAWDGVEAAGKIALVSRGSCTFAAKSLAASAAGASAILIYNNAAGTFGGTLGGANPDFVPTAGLQQAEGQALVADLAQGPVSVSFELRVLRETRRTFNVLAESRRGNPDNVVMLGAHLDGVQDGPGLNDNGSGTAALLEVATKLTSFHRFNNKVRFAWWAGEEEGLLGSTHYVNDLVTNNPQGLDAIASYLNFDMLGSPNYVIGVYDADASTYEPTAPVPPGSIETEQLFRDYFTSIGQPVVDQQFSGRSDYQAFILNGVAAGGLATGADGVKSESEAAIFGGTAGITYDPNYHKPGDNIANVSRKALDIQSDAIAHAVIQLCYDTSVIDPPAASGEKTRFRTVSPQLLDRR